MLVNPQMLGQLIDPGGQDGNLNLGGAGVALVDGVVQDDLGLLFLLNHCVFHLSIPLPGSQVEGIVECAERGFPQLSSGRKFFQPVVTSLFMIS